MSTGGEHYRQAEDLIRDAEGESSVREAVMLAAAQTHATLAVAAASIELCRTIAVSNGAGEEAAWTEALR